MRHFIHGKNLIGNKIVAKGTKTFQTFNVKDNCSNEWQFYQATEHEINEACELADSVFETFKNTTNKSRAFFLECIADEINKIEDDLLKLYCLESGLDMNRARLEKDRIIKQLLMFSNHLQKGDWMEVTIDLANSERLPNPKPDLRKMMVAVGPVVVFGASNFPLAYSTVGGDTVSALAAGCPVIVKSHQMHAGTGEMVASAVLRAIDHCSMPNGIFSNINGVDHSVGKQLVEHPKVKAVGFTGSLIGGRSLYDLCSKRKEPIPFFAEMGSINPILFLGESLQKETIKWVQTYANSITQSSGQFCTNPGLILGIASPTFDNFIEQLAKALDCIESMPMLHPSIWERYKKSITEQNNQSKIRTKTIKEEESKPNYTKAHLNVVNGEDFLINTILHHEVFGPSSLVVSCENHKILNQIIEELGGQLTATIIGNPQELKQFLPLITKLQSKVGRIIFNGVPTGVEVCESMTHGGPYPASTDSRYTAVGVNAIKRWLRPISFQNCPNELLPMALRNENPLGIKQTIHDNALSENHQI